MKRIILYLNLVLFSLLGCTKEEEDFPYTLLDGLWRENQYIIDGEESQARGAQHHFREGRVYRYQCPPDGEYCGDESSTTGTWEFINRNRYKINFYNGEVKIYDIEYIDQTNLWVTCFHGCSTGQIRMIRTR